jgi:tungstate transport system substrate-binding protein
MPVLNSPLGGGPSAVAHGWLVRSRAMMRRRMQLIAALAAWVSGASEVSAQQRRPTGSPLRLGVERLIADTGLADVMRRAFAGDTGLAVTTTAGASSALLESLERGELDAALTHAPSLESRLEAQGLVHDRRVVARSDFVLVGPAQRGKDPAGIAGGHDAAAALASIAAAGQPFLTLADGSGTHLAEQSIWRAAGVAPVPPWYRSVDPKAGGLLAQARAQQAYTLSDRASWLSLGATGSTRAGATTASPLQVLVQGDPRLLTEFHVQRPFRFNHPAAKLFVAWLAGPQGRRAVARVRGFQAPSR